jgi:hypothetical protein
VKYWHLILLPFTPLAIVAGFVVGVLRGRDRKIAFYCGGKPVTVGEFRRWAASTEKNKTKWEKMTH